MLEIASGTGQHAVHWAAALPALFWQPSDADPGALASIAARCEAASLPNLLPPLTLDVCGQPWPIERADALVCINMIHISPWEATLALFAGAEQLLEPEQPLILYGPYRRDGRHTAASNEAFDRSLRLQNPLWGVRDIEAVVEVATSHGFALAETVEMPANNLSVIVRRPALG